MARRRASALLFAPIDPASVAVFRVAFGLILAFDVLRYFLRGRIAAFFIEPDFHFTYYGFEWVRPWPGAWMYAHFAVMGVAALLMAAGIFYRASALTFALTFTFAFLAEKARYLNHYYLIILLAWILLVIPADRDLSWSARRRGARALPAWTLLLLRAQIGLVYFYAGVAKLNPDWVRALPLKSWLPARADLSVIGPLLAQEWTAWFFSYAAIALDLLAWPALMWRVTRLPTYVFLASFHFLNAAMFGIGMFPWLMLAATTLFFAPDWPRRFLRRAPTFAALRPPSSLARSAGAIALVAYLTLQVLAPLRHFLYPGRVSWTEEGHRFAWHMKLRSKDSWASFFVRDPATGVETTVDPRDELEDWQARKMAGRPDMVQQYARHLARTRAQPGQELEVRANVYSGLNGRSPSLLIDPDVDLVRASDGFGRAAWILPLE